MNDHDDFTGSESLVERGLLELALSAHGVEPEGEVGFAERVTDAVPFEEAGLLTNDRGVVVKLEDGSEFQVTVRQSR